MTGAAYLVLYLWALAPGLPAGFALFGRRHPAGWLAGALFGYVITALAVWAPIRLGIASAATFVAAWLVAAIAGWLAARELRDALVALPGWTRRDTVALAGVLALTLAIAIPPTLRAGARDAEGNRYYRAYFTADFAWHTALTAELAKFSSPPRNPYLAARPIHYYWTYFLLPGAAAGAMPHGLEHVETFLKVNAIGTAVLFVSAIFLCAWSAVPRAAPVAAAVVLAIVASSAEGTWALWRFWHAGIPLSDLRNLNIDALVNWWPPHGLRIDGLQRCFWWVPQHSMAYALGLLPLIVANAAGSAVSAGTILLCGAALGGAALMNPFVGAVFSAVWGVTVAIDAVRSGELPRRLVRHLLAVVPVALAIGWCVANQMVEGAGGALQVGWFGEARNAPLWSLALSLGPVAAAALPGVITGKSPASAVALAAVSLLLMYFVRLDVDRSWVGFRAGQMFLLAVPALIAAGLQTDGRWRKLPAAVAVAMLLVGAPTLAIDVFNAQDIRNFSPSPNGPWTVTVTRDETDGLAWLRTSTPAASIVQMEPFARERSTWSLIPSLAQRRMAAGRPISLLGGTENDSEYGVKSARVRTLYETSNARQAWEIARSLRIDYIWLDTPERAAYMAGAGKFDAAPELFASVFKQGAVSIYRVR